MPRIRKRKFGPGVPPPHERKPFRDVGRFLKETFGAKCYKVCVDGGFTCPNRDGTCGTGGCIFCGERGSGEFITESGIRNQIEVAMKKAQWKHHAQLGLEMRGIFGRSELREAVRANHGASVDELMQGLITDIVAGHGAYDRSTAGVQYFSDQIRGWTALCALGGNIGVMAKQTTSIPAFRRARRVSR